MEGYNAHSDLHLGWHRLRDCLTAMIAYQSFPALAERIAAWLVYRNHAMLRRAVVAARSVA